MIKKWRNYSDGKKLIIVACIMLIGFIISIFLMFFFPRPITSRALLFFLTMFCFTLFIFTFGTTVAAISFLIFRHIEKKDQKRDQKKLTAILSSNFSKVRLYNPSNIDAFVNLKDINCMAKIDEDGNIVYQLQVDATYSTKNYSWFMNHFKVEE